MLSDEETRRQEIADGERWLADFSTPSPSAESVARLKQAVSAEMARGVRPAARPWGAWSGVLAAAAALAMAVTIGWQSAGRHAEEVEVVAESTWLADTHEEAVVLTDLEENLSALENWSKDDSWNVSGSALYETLNDALEETPKSENAGDAGASAPLPPVQSRSEET